MTTLLILIVARIYSAVTRKLAHRVSNHPDIIMTSWYNTETNVNGKNGEMFEMIFINPGERGE